MGAIGVVVREGLGLRSLVFRRRGVGLHQKYLALDSDMSIVIVIFPVPNDIQIPTPPCLVPRSTLRPPFQNRNMPVNKPPYHERSVSFIKFYQQANANHFQLDSPHRSDPSITSDPIGSSYSSRFCNRFTAAWQSFITQARPSLRRCFCH